MRRPRVQEQIVDLDALAREPARVLSGTSPSGARFAFVTRGRSGTFYGLPREYRVFRAFDLATLAVGTVACSALAYLAMKHGIEASALLGSIDPLVHAQGVDHALIAAIPAAGTVFGADLVHAITGLRYGGLLKMPAYDGHRAHESLPERSAP